jgi:DNA-binding response OmpR family regulator
MPIDVLVVEDDDVLRDILVLHLQRAGYALRASATGDHALAECTRRLPDIVVLDLSLPGASGLSICAALRDQRPTPGILIVTARASEADVILGFDSGADDYVVKPCRPREVVARVAALARRVRRGDAEHEMIRRGRLEIDLSARRVTVSEAELRLTPTEHALLVELARDPGVVKTRKALLRTVFDISHEGYARNVDCHVTRLRRKLSQAGFAGDPIDTIPGAGYRWSREAC